MEGGRMGGRMGAKEREEMIKEKQCKRQKVNILCYKAFLIISIARYAKIFIKNTTEVLRKV